MRLSVFKAAITTAALAGLTGPLSASASSTAAETRQTTFDVSVLAATCFNCHGTDGRSPGAIPAIAGRPESALRAQLKAFKSETPPAGTTVMDRHAKGYSDEEIDALASYFSKIRR